MQRLQHLISLKAAFPKNSAVPLLIEQGNLYPIDDWHTWTDYDGYKLIVSQDRKVQIKPNQDWFRIFDLFYWSSLKYLLSKSKQVAVITADSNTWVAVLGSDQIWRLRQQSVDGWNHVPLLSLKLEILLSLLKQQSNVSDCNLWYGTADTLTLAYPQLTI